MPFLPPNFGLRNSEETLPLARRIVENFVQALSLSQARLPFASAALPFSPVNTSTRYGSAQTASVLAHVAIFCGLLALLATHPIPPAPVHPTPLGSADPLLRYIRPDAFGTGKPSLGLRGGGGENDPLPARQGLLAPRSSMPLAPPRLPHSQQVEMPVAPAVFDANAPASVPVITNLGLPWMNADTNSAGPGKGHGIGSGANGGMGDDEGGEGGRGNDSGDYANVVSLATCLYCPEPPYTDEARKAKLQGTVTLHALIGADGRARRIQVIKGLGLGLDERASEAVRVWRFVPARNAQRLPIASWVTIETRFQLL